jgi:hypothetical protein
MSAPRSVRFELATVTRLASYASRHPGMTSSGAAALLVEEGLRMDAHPGVLFREGPSGRRAVLAAGPDVWEVIRAVRDARAAEPELGPEEILALVSENTGLGLPQVRVAVGYYGSFAEEVDHLVAEADEAQDRLRRSLAHTAALLRA